MLVFYRSELSINFSFFIRPKYHRQQTGLRTVWRIFPLGLGIQQVAIIERNYHNNQMELILYEIAGENEKFPVIYCNLDEIHNGLFIFKVS